MNNLSTQIGALELAPATIGFNDGALEASAIAAAGPTHSVATCPGGLTRMPVCYSQIDDGALEASIGLNPPMQPTRPRFMGGNCVGDTAL